MTDTKVLPKDQLKDFKFGDVDGGNYTEIKFEDGTIILHGDATVYDDLQMQLIGQRLESPSSNIIQNDSESSLTFEADCVLTDYVTMNIQMSHRWVIGTNIYPHLHWWQTESNVPNWLIQYRWQINGQAKETSWTSVAYTSHAFTYISGTLNQITVLSSITPPGNASLSDIVQIRILRDTNNDSTLFGGVDPVTGNQDAVNFDIHTRFNTLGSDTEYTK